MNESTNTQNDVNEEILAEIRYLVDTITKEVLKDGTKNILYKQLKGKVESWIADIKKDGKITVEEITSVSAKAIEEMKSFMSLKKEDVIRISKDAIRDFISEIDMDDDLKKGITLLTSEGFVDVILELPKLWEETKRSNKDIVINAPKLLGGIITLVCGFVYLVIWLYGLVAG